MKTWAAAAVVVAVLGGLVVGQTPEMYDMSDVLVGAQRLQTKWLLAVGKWSNAGKDASVTSTEIHCYKRFGFCEVSSALSGGTADVSVDDFDILRWDTRELIAVDSSPICAAYTLRVEFKTKKVSLSSTSKHVTEDETCKDMDATPPCLKQHFS
jgi:hypothetical protein